MNIFKMNQMAFPKADEVARDAKRRRGIFHIPKKPGNVSIFLISFLTYMIGIFPSMVYALPSGGTVQAGSATIDSVSSQQMTIQQTSEKAIIDWQTFDIESAEQVDFKLSQGGVTLNRVTGNDPTHIFGKLTSNGDLWLVNPNGVLFGSNSQVDVNGLIATTSDISNTNFLNGDYNFNLPSSLSATVVNQGHITAAEGGLVALVAPGVQNSGVINARLGKVSLASGKTFTVDLYGDQLINLGVDSQVMGQVTGADGEILTSLIDQSGSIFADGGVVRLDVNAAQNIVDRVINMDGIIQAHSVVNKNGQIILIGGSAGEVSVSGTLDASGYGLDETGGTVHVLGDSLSFTGNGFIDVSGDRGGGTLLFGGDYQGQGWVPNATDAYIGPDTQTFANAVSGGEGGKVIFWADRRMRFLGIVKGRGGQYFGDGGFVEVSGKEELYFDGLVDTTAPNGKTGTLLLDPDTITIADGSGTTTASGASTFTTIYEDTLEAVSASTNITLLATSSILLSDLSDNLLNLQQGSGNSVTFTVTNGTISFASSTDTISTNGGSINFNATQGLTIGSLASNGGDISLIGSDLSLSGTLSSGTGNISITHVDSGKIGLGGTTCTGSCDMSLNTTELGNMSGNQLIIGGESNGDIYVDGVTQTTSTFSNGVELNVGAHLSGSKGAIIFNGTASSFSTLTANAVDGIEVNANLTTTTGALTLDGDSDNVVDTQSATDNISFASGITLTSASSISLSATNGGMTTAGDLTLSAPTSISMTGAMTGAGAIALSANNGITLNSGISTTGSLAIEADADNSGSASTDKLTLGSGITLSAGGALSLDATTGGISALGALTLISTGSTLAVSEALTVPGALTMTAASGLTLSDSTLTAAGNISIEADSTNSGAGQLVLASGTTITASAGAISLGATTGGISTAGSLTLNATNGITVEDSLTTAGAVVIDADTDNNGSGDFTLSSGSLSTTSNALTLTANDLTLAGTLNSGTASTAINVSDSGSLGIGLSSGFGMNISTTEQANIIGTGDLSFVNGNITISANNSLISSGKLTIGQSGGSITGQGALTLSAAKGLDLDSSITSAGNLILEGDSNNSADSDDSISLASGVSLIASAGSITLDATTGGLSAAGAVSFYATTGITLNDSLTSAGTTTFDADTDNDGTGSLTLAALNTGNNALSMTAADLILNNTLTSGTADTTILASKSASTIGLGTTSDLSLSTTELANITAGSLTIGGSTNGDITVSGVSSIDSDQFGALTLNATASGSSVTFGSSDSTFQGLTVNAENGITLSSNLTTNGVTNFNADSDGDGTGSFTLATNKTLATTNNALSLTSSDLILGSGSLISSGTAGTTLLTALSGTTIGLGAGTGIFTLTNDELGQITSGNLTVGNSTNGDIIIDGVSSTSFGALSLNSGAALTFSSTASSFSGLTLDAGSGVAFGADVSTTGNLSVTSGGTITDTGTLTIAGTSSFTTDVANQAITLDNTLNAFTGAVSLNTSGSSGNATLSSDNAIILSTATVGGDLAVTVGGDNSLNMTGAGTAGGSINLLADNDIIFTSSGDLTTTTGNILVTADNDSDNNGSGGALTMVEGTVFDAGSGTLVLSADEDITLGLLQTTSSSDTAVTLTSTGGGVFDGDTDESLDIDAGNGRLVADVATGFGTELNAIETRVSSVDIDNTTSGDINIFESDSLEVFKIDQAGPGDIEVSYQGAVSGVDKAIISFTGLPKGTITFTRRDIKDQIIEGTGKSLGQLAFGATQQLDFQTFEFKVPDFQNKTPVNRVAGSPNGPFTMDLFSENFDLVDLAQGTEGKFDGMEVTQSFWGGPKKVNLEVAERSNTKSVSKHRTAKRKKRGRKKIGETASVPIKKARRVQKSKSGYLSLAPSARRGALSSN
jgi:filamentous hemagglutinin family protein